MGETWQTLLEQQILLLGKILEKLFQQIMGWSLLIVWLAWWLWGVNWKKAWPVLARGAWVPVALVMVVVALVWSQIAPSEGDCFGLFKVGNFWWQLGDVCLLVALTLFCGWLQGVSGWEPAEVNLEPPAPQVSVSNHTP